MTAIAYRDGVMAADTACWSGTVILCHTKRIARVGSMLVAATGPLAIAERFREWVDRGAAGDFCRDDLGDAVFDGIIVKPDGIVLRIGRIGPPMHFSSPFHALGDAQEVLAVAMAAGAWAEQAVKIAITYTSHAAGGIQVEKLHNDELVEKIVGAPFPAAA